MQWPPAIFAEFVCRSVVHDNDLQITHTLICHAVERLAQVLLPVANAQDY